MKFNPFSPNSIVSTNLFAGRTDYVFKILGKLMQVQKGMPSSFFLYGERGIGKTALAKLIKSIAEDKDPELGNLNFLTSYYSIEKNQSITASLESGLNELTDKIPSSTLSILGAKLGALLTNGKFSIGPFGVELKSIDDKIIAVRDQLISILSNVIEAIKNTEEEKRKDGIFIIIDELDNVNNIDLCAQLFRGIITTLDVKGLGNISFLLIGYKSTLDKFFMADSSARRQFDPIRLGVMPNDEAMEVLIKGFKKVGITWDNEALSKKIFVTGGYPHSIQLLGHNLVEQDIDNNIDNKDLDAAISNTAKELQSKDFAEMYHFHGKVGNREKILDALAFAAGPLSCKEIEKYAHVKYVSQYISDLEKRGSISVDKESGKIYLHSHLFRMAIMSKIFNKIIEEDYLSELFAIRVKSQETK